MTPQVANSRKTALSAYQRRDFVSAAKLAADYLSDNPDDDEMLDLAGGAYFQIGAIDGTKFQAELEYIAPKGQDVEGAIQFEIKAALKPTKDATIRAGYSANAQIVLDRREQVLAIEESLLQFEGETAYVEVQVAPGQFEMRDAEGTLVGLVNRTGTGGLELCDAQGEVLRQITPAQIAAL